MSIDFVLILLSSLFVFYGYSSGLLSQLSKLFAGIIAYLVAKLFYVEINNFLIEQQIISQDTSYILSFVLIIILIFISIKFLSSSIESFLKTIGLNFTNKIAGGIFGLIKAVFILSLISFSIVKLNFVEEPKTVKDFSYFRLLFEIGSMLIKSYLN